MHAPDPLVLGALLLQLVVPLGLVVHVAHGRRRDRMRLTLDAAFAALYLASIALAGLWLALPRWLVGAYGALLAGAVAIAVRRRPPGSAGTGIETAPREGPVGTGQARLAALPWVRTLGVLCAGAMLLYVLAGRRLLPGEPVDLVFPLSGGPYLVAAGGSNELLNPHVATLEGERFRPYRGQSYAVDVVGIGAWGSRRSLALSPDPEAFAVFGRPILAPCTGTVVRAADGQPDQLPPGRSPGSLEGNHVILACGEIRVLLAHMARGSVAAHVGDTVRAGDPLGCVGNSGNSDEPHLHIHAQRPGTDEEPLGGSPVPITFEGRRPVRNDRIHGRLQDTTGGPLVLAPAGPGCF